MWFGHARILLLLGVSAATLLLTGGCTATQSEARPSSAELRNEDARSHGNADESRQRMRVWFGDDAP